MPDATYRSLTALADFSLEYMRTARKSASFQRSWNSEYITVLPFPGCSDGPLAIGPLLVEDRARAAASCAYAQFRRA